MNSLVVYNAKDILESILDIIGYEDNKQNYIEKFTKKCENEALSNELSALTQEKQLEFQKLLESNPSAFLEAVNKEVDQEKYIKALENSSKVNFMHLLKSLLPGLSQKQKDTLITYLRSIDLKPELPF